MKKTISVISEKIIPISLFLFVGFTTYSTEMVRTLPNKYYPTKKTSQFLKKTSVKTTFQPTFFIIQAKEGDLMEVPRDIIQLSNVIKAMLKDSDDAFQHRIPIEFTSRNTLAIIFNNILPYYKNNPENIESYIKETFKDLTLEELIDITNTLNYLDIGAIHKPDIPAPLLSIFTKKIFDIITTLNPQEIATQTTAITKLTSDLQQSLIEYVIPCLKNRIIQLYGNDKSRITTSPLHTKISCIAFNHDTTQFVSASAENDLTIWNTETFEQMTSIKHSCSIFNIAFSHDGTKIVLIDRDRNLVSYKAPSLEKVFSTPINQAVTALRFNPDGSQIITGDIKGAIIAWDATTLTKTTEITGHTEAIKGIAFSPNGKYLISCSSYINDQSFEKPAGNNLILWDALTFKKITNFNNYTAQLQAVTFSPDSSKIVSVGFERDPSITGGSRIAWIGSLVVWNTQTFEKIAHFDKEPSQINSVIFSPDGAYFVSAGKYRVAALWNGHTLQKIIDFETNIGMDYLAFKPDSKQFLYRPYQFPESVCCWTLLTPEELQTLDDLKISNTTTYQHALLIHKICGALEQKTTVSLSPDELNIFIKLSAFIQGLLKDGIDSTSSNKQADSSTSTQQLTNLEEQPIAIKLNLMQRASRYGAQLLRWWKGEHNK